MEKLDAHTVGPFRTLGLRDYVLPTSLLNKVRQHIFSRLLSSSHPPAEKRSSAKQDSFRKKLLRRNKSDTCDICGEQAPALEASHIVALAHKELLETEYDKDPDNLPISVNDATNGVLLCPSCHDSYDRPIGKKSKKRFIHIKPDGTIVLNGKAEKINYKKLNGKKVPWIPGQSHYPTPELLQFALTLDPVKGKTTMEKSEEQEDEDEDEDEEHIPKTLFSTSHKGRKPNKKRKNSETESAEYVSETSTSGEYGKSREGRKSNKRRKKTEMDSGKEGSETLEASGLHSYGLRDNEQDVYRTSKSYPYFPCLSYFTF